MRTRTQLATLLLAFSSVTLFSQNPQPTVISVDTTHPGAAISPSEFGIFFEDINFGADGGLYPELVKNRSFEFSEPLTGWHEVLAIDSTGRGLEPLKGEISVHTKDPLNASNPHYLRVRVYNPGYAFYNVGFRGIGVQAGAEYRFSAYIRSKSGGPTALRATITDATGKVLGSGKLEGAGT